MSVEYAVRAVRAEIERRIVGVSAFRATVTAVDGSLIQIRREGATTGNDEQYASCTRFLLAVGDVVLCIPLGLKPVVIDVIRRSAAASPTFTAQAAAGSTATTTGAEGTDTAGTIRVNPSGAGITTGTIVRVTFAVPRPSDNYVVIFSNASADTRALDLPQSIGGKTVDRFDLATNTALTTGGDYRWDYFVYQFAN